MQFWKPQVQDRDGVISPVSERMGWDSSGQEQLLPAGEQGGLQGSPSKPHTPVLGWAGLCRFGAVGHSVAQWDTPVPSFCTQRTQWHRWSFQGCAQPGTLHRALGHTQVALSPGSGTSRAQNSWEPQTLGWMLIGRSRF